MRKFLFPWFVAMVFAAAPVVADIDAVIDDHIIKRHADFAKSALTLAETAANDCMPEALKPAFHAAFDDWIGISHIRFGPIEQNGEGLAVVFWPDKKGMISKTLMRMIKSEDAVVTDSARFARYSVAARGFFALEQMLFDDRFSDYATDSYACGLTRAMTVDLARIAEETYRGWTDGFADILRTAGAEGNTVFLSEKEGVQALYTNMLTGLEYITVQRLGRPLGSFEKPRPRRAEARRSTRSLRNIVVSLESIREMVEMMADGQASETMEIFQSTLNYARGLDDHVFEGLNETSSKFKLGSLQELVTVVHEAAAAEIGTHLDVGAGFNALDGD